MDKVCQGLDEVDNALVVVVAEVTGFDVALTIEHLHSQNKIILLKENNV